MKRCIQFLIFTGILFSVMEVSGQFSDSFSDGNLTENPSWTGDISHFIVNAEHQLQLYQSEEGRSVLAVDNYLVDSTEWFFGFRLVLRLLPIIIWIFIFRLMPPTRFL